MGKGATAAVMVDGIDEEVLQRAVRGDGVFFVSVSSAE
jgi:hypothetical protein